MNLRNNYSTGIQIRFVNQRTFCDRYGLGLSSGYKLAQQIGCIHRVGRRTLYDIIKADAWFDEN